MTDEKHAGGRPTLYDPKYCEEIVEFFSVEDTVETDVEYTNKKGETWSKSEEKSNRLPTFAGFARKIGVHRDTLDEWKKVHPEFSDACKKCQAVQEEILVNNALRGLYNPAFSIFFAKNNLGYRDKTETDLTVKKDGAKELMDQVFGEVAEEQNQA